MRASITTKSGSEREWLTEKQQRPSLVKNFSTLTVGIEELLVSSLAQTDALAKLLIKEGVITQEEFLQKIAEERSTLKGSIPTTLFGLCEINALLQYYLAFHHTPRKNR